jgi:hypothetical protein
MSNGENTIQTILLQVANLLEPLQRELGPGRARITLAEIGIIITGAQESAIAGPLQATAGNIRDMLQLAAELTKAIEAEDVSNIAARSLGLIKKILDAIQSIDGVKIAIAGLGIGIPQSTIDKIPERLFNLLLVSYLEKAHGVNELLEFFGILERVRNNEGSVDPNNPPYTVSTFNFGRIGDWLASPTDVLSTLYQWDGPAFNGIALLARLEDLLLKIDTPAYFDSTAIPPKLDIVLIEVKPKTDVSPKGLSISLRSNLSTGIITVGQDDWKVQFKLDFQLPFDTELIIQPGGNFTIVPPSPSGTYAGVMELKFIGDRSQATEPYIIIGESDGNRLEVRKFEVGTGGEFHSNGGESKAEFSISGGVEGGKLVISFENADGFLGKILSGVHLESEFAFGFGYSSAEGLFFTGSSTLEIQLPLHLSLGPVEISALTFSVGIENKKFPTAIAADIKTELGPLQAVVENVGLRVDFAFKDNRDGNAGPLDVQIGFKPPKGVGLSLDTGVVRGGGYLYFDFDKEEYAGALELSFLDIVTVKAVGLITTRMPDGSQGFSLLIIISAEFMPIQLGFGFTLNAVGGLLGLNRTVVLDALRDSVRTGAINSIMFPTNIVANAPKIISDLKVIFPPCEGKFLIGPMVKFGWGTPSLITLSLGLIIEIPGNIAILGVLKVVLPAEEAALILLQVNFVGTLDFDKKMLTFDASLFESRILFITLEGDMAVRLKWGDDGAFLLSVGGFHPSFEPPPLSLPTLRRIAVNILDFSWARIRIEAYYAVTSNTVQFGSQAELYFGFDGLNVSGHIGYDVLFQFSPFHFIAQISGSLSLEAIGVDVLSIRLKFSLEGPSPWRAKGSGSVSILFWDIDVDFDITWGEEENTTLPPIEVMPLLVAEVGKKDNWKALPPASNNLLVSLRQLDPTLLVLHPVGSLTVTQRAVPLSLTLDKVGNQKPSDVNRIEITSALSGATTFNLSPVLESFAPAQFEELSDAEKLSRPSYQKLTGGVIISMGGGSLQSSKMTKRKIEYEVTIIDKEPVPLLPYGKLLKAVSGLFSGFLRGAAVAKSKLSFHYKTQLQPFAEKIAVKPEGYSVAFNHNNKAFSSAATFESEAMAMDYMKQQLSANPGLKETLHVIPNYEVNNL